MLTLSTKRFELVEADYLSGQKAICKWTDLLLTLLLLLQLDFGVLTLHLEQYFPLLDNFKKKVCLNCKSRDINKRRFELRII